MTKQFSNYSDLITFTRASEGHALRPVSYGDELVTNGTFTDNIDGWQASSVNATLSHSTDALQVVATGGGVGAVLSSAITVEVGKIYTVEVESTSATGRHQVRVGNSSATSSEYFLSGLINGVASKFTATFVATKPTLYIYLRNHEAGTTTWDNISVKEVLFDQPDGTLTLFEHPDDVPRVEYDADGNRLGLLVEEARTNLITHSDFDGANPTGWTTFSLGGTRTATTLYGLPAIRFQSTGERPLLQIPLTLSASTTYTISCYIENAGGTPAEILQLNGFSGVTGDSRIYANEADGKGYISNTFTTGTDASGYLRIGIGVVSPSTGDVTITAIQIEEGSFGTSYIKTTGSTATRSADVASIPVADFGYNQSAGTLFVEAKTFSNAEANHGDFALTDGATSPDLMSGSRTGSSVAGTYSTWYRTGGTTQANLVRTSAVEDNVFYKAGFCYKANDFAQSVDGGSILSDSSGTVPSRNSVVLIGDNYYGKLNGHIKSIKYFPRRLTNAQLVDLTS